MFHSSRKRGTESSTRIDVGALLLTRPRGNLRKRAASVMVCLAVVLGLGVAVQSPAYADPKNPHGLRAKVPAGRPACPTTSGKASSTAACLLPSGAPAKGQGTKQRSAPAPKACVNPGNGVPKRQGCVDLKTKPTAAHARAMTPPGKTLCAAAAGKSSKNATCAARPGVTVAPPAAKVPGGQQACSTYRGKVSKNASCTVHGKSARANLPSDQGQQPQQNEHSGYVTVAMVTEDPSQDPTPTLTASATTAHVFESPILTAVTTIDVGPTPWEIVIWDETRGYPAAECGIGDTCVTGVSDLVAESDTYFAVVGDVDENNTLYNIQGGQSPDVTIEFLPGAAPISLSLTANATTISQFGSAIVTATSSFDLTETPYAIFLMSTDTGEVLAECDSGSQCSTWMYTDGPGQSGFRAVLADWQTFTEILATAPQVSVIWQAASLEVSATSTTPSDLFGTNVTFTIPGDTSCLTCWRPDVDGYCIWWINNLYNNQPTPHGCGWFMATASHTITMWGGMGPISESIGAILSPDYNSDPNANPYDNVIARSPFITIHWQLDKVALTADTSSASTSGQVTLTATAPLDVSATVWDIMIYDSSITAPIADCWWGSSCSTTITQSAAATDTFQAFVAQRDWDDHPIRVQAVSGPTHVMFSNGPSGSGSPLALAQAHSPGTLCAYGSGASSVYCAGATLMSPAAPASLVSLVTSQPAFLATVPNGRPTGSGNALVAASLPTQTPGGVSEPTQCAAPDMTDPGASYESPDRFTSCSDIRWTITEHRVVDGEDTIVGMLIFDDTQWAEFSQLVNDPSWIHGITITVDLVEGTQEHALAAVGSHCSVNVNLCKVVGSLMPDPNSVEFVQGESWTNEWAESDTAMMSNASNVDYLNGYIGTDFEFDWGGFTDDGSLPGIATGLDGRCDSISRYTNCVNDNYVPTLAYNALTNPLVAPVADHIYLAQQSLHNHWGNARIGLALHYDSNDADQSANRRVACASVVTGPGDSCDEYPMASTYEGAAFQSDYSTAVVPASANSSQGGITGYFLSSNHVLDGTDAFWVKATLGSGVSSW